MIEIQVQPNRVALIDDEDLRLVTMYAWYLGSHGYAINSDGKTMHSLIMQPPKGKVVDHINRNQLDNRRSNLRVCTQTQNLLNAKIARNNTSGHKGVHWYKAYQKWQVYIRSGKNRKFLGYFDDLNEAIKARQEAERAYI